MSIKVRVCFFFFCLALLSLQMNSEKQHISGKGRTNMDCKSPWFLGDSSTVWPYPVTQQLSIGHRRLLSQKDATGHSCCFANVSKQPLPPQTDTPDAP